MPLFYKKSLSSQVQLGVWKITESDEELISKLTLNDDELAHLQTIKHSKRFKHWLASRVLIKQLLQTNKFIEFEYDKNGKPNLVNVEGHVSISHAADVAAIALSRTKNIGIDIEKMQEKIVRIAPKFMLAKEIEASAGEDQILEMYIHWCVREAVYKCYGRRQLDFRKHILLEPLSELKGQVVPSKIKKGDIEIAYEVVYDRIGDYLIAYTSSDDTESIG